MRTYGIIPARLKSSRLPRKLLLTETEKPLLLYAWEAACRAERLDEVIVATDSEELAERLPNSELVVISGAAHGFMVEHATTFNRVLFDFLGRTTKAHRAAAAEPAAAAS